MLVCAENVISCMILHDNNFMEFRLAVVDLGIRVSFLKGFFPQYSCLHTIQIANVLGQENMAYNECLSFPRVAS